MKAMSYKNIKKSLEPVHNLFRSKAVKANLQAGIEFSLTIFPQSPTFFQPSKRSLDNPPFWQYSKGM